MPRDKTNAQARFGRSPAAAVDRHVCRRIRERRIQLGLTQQQIAQLIGVTQQQAQKYEDGSSRICAGRLFTLAQALEVDVGYFVDGMNVQRSFVLMPHHSAFLEFMHDFINMAGIHKKAISRFAREMAERKLALVYDINDGGPRERRDLLTFGGRPALRRPDHCVALATLFWRSSGR